MTYFDVANGNVAVVDGSLARAGTIGTGDNTRCRMAFFGDRSRQELSRQDAMLTNMLMVVWPLSWAAGRMADCMARQHSVRMAEVVVAAALNPWLQPGSS